METTTKAYSEIILDSLRNTEKTFQLPLYIKTDGDQISWLVEEQITILQITNNKIARIDPDDRAKFEIIQFDDAMGLINSITIQRITRELNKIEELYDYNPNVQIEDNDISTTITWEDYEEDVSVIRISEGTITLLSWDDPDFSKQITYEQFLWIIHGNDIPTETKPEEKPGKILMSEMCHTMQFLQNMGFKTEHLTIEETFTIKKTILKALEEQRNYKPELEVKNPFQ